MAKVKKDSKMGRSVRTFGVFAPSLGLVCVISVFSNLPDTTEKNEMTSFGCSHVFF